MALLSADDVPQDKNCAVGPIWTNCDGAALTPLDHETRQMFEDAEKSYQLAGNEAAITFYFQTVSYTLSPSKMENVDFSLIIDIIVNASGAEKRQDILDTIEERLWYRFYSYAQFTDATTGAKYRSFMHWLRQNNVTVTTNDDSNFAGRYTIRTMRLAIGTDECIRKTDCGDVELCFDFDVTPDFGKGC